MKKCVLGDIADLSLGKMLDAVKNRGQPREYLSNIDVRWGSFDLDHLKQMRFEDCELEKFGLRLGDIVMCEGGEPGRCAIWKNERPGMMIQKALHRIRPHDSVCGEYLFPRVFRHKCGSVQVFEVPNLVRRCYAYAEFGEIRSGYDARAVDCAMASQGLEICARATPESDFAKVFSEGHMRQSSTESTVA